MSDKYVTISIPVEEMREIEQEEIGLVSDEITGTTRWSILHSLVFKYKDGKTYRTSYSVGATESQYEGPWEYDSGSVECFLVEEVEKVVKVWEAVLAEK